MWEPILILSFALFVINVVFWVIAVRIFSGIYQSKFNTVVQIIHDGMAERDAKLRELQAMLSRSFVTDTRLFDLMLEDEDEPVAKESTNERQEEN
jgi:hypothetical protein